MKNCNKCNIQKSFDCFDKEKQGRFGLRSDCKSCRKLYRESRKDIMKVYHQEYYKEHKEEYDKRSNEWRKNNKERVAELASLSFKRNREKSYKYKKEYYNKHKDDIIYKLVYRVRNRTKNAIRAKKFYKNFKYPDYIGCSREELKLHIEKQFTEGMTWEKFFSGEIHIDHIIPIGKAESPEEVFKLSHYTNLQPLWAKDNLKKGAK